MRALRSAIGRSVLVSSRLFFQSFGDRMATAVKATQRQQRQRVLAPVPFGFSVLGIDRSLPCAPLMVIAAVRYCLGRKTYIVHDCASWILAIWPLLEAGTQTTIRRDVDDAFAEHEIWQRDHAAAKASTASGAVGDGLAVNAAYLAHGSPLGMDCDVAAWRMVRSLWVAPVCCACGCKVRDAGIESMSAVHVPGSTRLSDGRYLCPKCDAVTCADCGDAFADGSSYFRSGADGTQRQCTECRNVETQRRGVKEF